MIKTKDMPKKIPGLRLYAVTIPHIYERVMGMRGLLNIS